MFNIRKKGVARIKNYKSGLCDLGHKHHSKGEAEWCNILQKRQKTGEFKEFTGQTSFDYIINGKKVCSHIPDFLITANDGTQWVEEFKGMETDVWRLKKKLFEALFPEIPYIVIKPSTVKHRR